MQYLNTTVQQGQATIVATFNLGSNQTTDEVEVQRRLQSTRAVLPTDLSPPSVGTFDPGEATVVTLVVTSSQLNTADLSSLVTNNIVPDLEQIDGIANVNAGGTVTPAIEVEVDPNKIAASQFTLGDVVSAISNNNVRAPGGIAYGSARETSIDVRGDVTTAQNVADLPLAAAANGSTGGAVITGPEGGTGLTSSGTGAVGGTAATSFASAGNVDDVAIGRQLDVVDGIDRQRGVGNVGERDEFRHDDRHRYRHLRLDEYRYESVDGDGRYHDVIDRHDGGRHDDERYDDGCRDDGHDRDDVCRHDDGCGTRNDGRHHDDVDDLERGQRHGHDAVRQHGCGTRDDGQRPERDGDAREYDRQRRNRYDDEQRERFHVDDDERERTERKPDERERRDECERLRKRRRARFYRQRVVGLGGFVVDEFDRQQRRPEQRHGYDGRPQPL